jgi:hypothetical protein
MNGGIMTDRGADEDVGADLLERRWFASMAAAQAKQAECNALLEVMALARASWHESNAALLRLEALRDALGERLSEQSALREEFVRAPAPALPISSAA